MNNPLLYRVFFASLFLGFALITNSLKSSWGSGQFYFVIAAACDACVVALLWRCSKFFGEKCPCSALVKDLQIINLAAILVDVIGLVLYHAYVPGEVHNSMIISLMAFQWYRLICIGPNDACYRATDNPFGTSLVVYFSALCRQRDNTERYR
jgi:hypothetical protein